MIADEVAREFPDDVDGFIKLVEHVKSYNDVSLDAPYISAQEVVSGFIKSRVLRDMIFVLLCIMVVQLKMIWILLSSVSCSKFIFRGLCRPRGGKTIENFKKKVTR